MSVRIPSLNGTCPCRPCQLASTRTPAQRERRKRIKIMDAFVNQTGRMK